MTAINLALRDIYGYVIWGNSLKNEERLVYRTGFNLRGFIRPASLDECPRAVHQAVDETRVESASGPPEIVDKTNELDSGATDAAPTALKQLRLF